MLTIDQLNANLPQQGKIQWIGIRPGKRVKIASVDKIEVSPEAAILGDRYSSAGGKRQVTLLQYEHLAAIASMLNIDAVTPESLRRNLVVKGVNLLALKGRHFRIGTAVLEYTGLCHPCSRMEETFGEGGYNAVRGHGGITARVLSQGGIARGDPLCVLPVAPTTPKKPATSTTKSSGQEELFD